MRLGNGPHTEYGNGFAENKHFCSKATHSTVQRNENMKTWVSLGKERWVQLVWNVWWILYRIIQWMNSWIKVNNGTHFSTISFSFVYGYKINYQLKIRNWYWYF